jgi:predicted glycosyltransferase
MELLLDDCSTEGAPVETAARRRVIVYADGAAGLVGLHRTLAVLHRVAEADPAVSMLVLTGLPAEPYFALPAGCDTVRLPADRELRRAVALAAARSFRPDVALVDTLPLGDELEPTLFALRSRGCRIVLGLHDADTTLAQLLGPPERVRVVRAAYA